jgi:hypothetical protein
VASFISQPTIATTTDDFDFGGILMIVELEGGGEEIISSIVDEIEQLPDSALVLDVGGGVKPLRRANYVVDLLPYEERGSYGYRGRAEEHFSKGTWIIADVCSPEDWPFEDKKFDYIFVSQIIEDVRDPIRLLKHIQRIGKRGFISTVHWTYEANDIRWGYTGFPHHRWLISLKDGRLEFAWKSPVLYSNRKIRPRVRQMLYHLKWEDSFDVCEVYYPGEHESQIAFIKSLMERWR